MVDALPGPLSAALAGWERRVREKARCEETGRRPCEFRAGIGGFSRECRPARAVVQRSGQGPTCSGTLRCAGGRSFRCSARSARPGPTCAIGGRQWGGRVHDRGDHQMERLRASLSSRLLRVKDAQEARALGRFAPKPPRILAGGKAGGGFQRAALVLRCRGAVGFDGQPLDGQPAVRAALRGSGWNGSGRIGGRRRRRGFRCCADAPRPSSCGGWQRWMG